LESIAEAPLCQGAPTMEYLPVTCPYFESAQRRQRGGSAIETIEYQETRD